MRLKALTSYKITASAETTGLPLGLFKEDQKTKLLEEMRAVLKMEYEKAEG